MIKAYATFKKGIVFLIMLCMLLSVIPMHSLALTVSDISGNSAQPTIQDWIDKGLIKGYPDGTFRPNNSITRAEFMALINRVYGFTDTAAISFSDVTDEWYYNDVAIAVKAGYILGYTDQTMRPLNPITREEAAAIIMRLNKLAENPMAANMFTDAANFKWSKGAIGAAYTAGIMMGTNGSFNNMANITRAETVTTLDSAHSALKPVIQLIGLGGVMNAPAPSQEIQDGAPVIPYYDPGVVAFAGAIDLTGSVVVTGDTVDRTKSGTYTITYAVTFNMQTVTVKRYVRVVDMLDPTTIPKFEDPMLVPWTMPTSANADPNADPAVDYYEIAMKQFSQQMLPASMGMMTTVWGYGDASRSDAVFHAPSLSVEAQSNRPARVKWINGLLDANGNYLPPITPIDQTVHWANPSSGPDMATDDPTAYVGPVPIITHLHGAHVGQESDGYPEAWYLPDSNYIPDGYITEGSSYNKYKATAPSGNMWTAGAVVYDYPNDQAAATLWYHDHAMGITRNNVYSGPAGFWMLRDTGNVGVVGTLPGNDKPLDYDTAMGWTLDDSACQAYEIPIALQDRSFNEDGSLFFPDSRFYFDGFTGPYVGTGDSDILPMHNPEFFGNTIIANGVVWPYLNVEAKQYRFRFLNGCEARTFILQLEDSLGDDVPMYLIGGDQGYLASTPLEMTQVQMMAAERYDVVIDFSGYEGQSLTLKNFGPDEPFGGGVPGVDFASADPATTGQIMEFRVMAASGADASTPALALNLPATYTPVAAATTTPRELSLNELSSNILFDEEAGEPVGPRSALLGTVYTDPDTGMKYGVPQMWSAATSEKIIKDSTETWTIYNFTMDAHPIHLHLVNFMIVGRRTFDMATGELGPIMPPNAWEMGPKDTAVAYPGEALVIQATFDMAGIYVWHCHIIDHEDNEMMRPYEVINPTGDTTAPVVTLNGSDTITLHVGDTYVDEGATSNDMTAMVMTMNTVNTAGPDEYYVTYSATDASGNTGMAVRTVIVQ